MEEHEIQQTRKSIDVDKQESKLSAIATACIPTMIEEKFEEDDNAFNNIWIRPKKFASTEHFDKKSKEELDVENV